MRPRRRSGGAAGEAKATRPVVMLARTLAESLPRRRPAEVGIPTALVADGNVWRMGYPEAASISAPIRATRHLVGYARVEAHQRHSGIAAQHGRDRGVAGQFFRPVQARGEARGTIRGAGPRLTGGAGCCMARHALFGPAAPGDHARAPSVFHVRWAPLRNPPTRIACDCFKNRDLNMPHGSARKRPSPPPVRAWFCLWKTGETKHPTLPAMATPDVRDDSAGHIRALGRRLSCPDRNCE